MDSRDKDNIKKPIFSSASTHTDPLRNRVNCSGHPTVASIILQMIRTRHYNRKCLKVH